MEPTPLRSLALLERCQLCCCCFCCAAAVTLTHTGTRRAGASAPHLCFGCCWLPTLLLPAIWLCWLFYCCQLAPSLARSGGRSVGLLGSEFTVKLSTCAHQGSDKCIGGREQRRVRNFYALNSRSSLDFLNFSTARNGSRIKKTTTTTTAAEMCVRIQKIGKLNKLNK